MKPGVAKHPRFSLRTIVLATAVLAVLLYGCVVRPTMLAQQLVAAVKSSDYTAVDRLVGSDDWRSPTIPSIKLPPQESRIDGMYAELFPRDVSDWLRCRRRIVVRIARHWDVNVVGRHSEWSEDVDFVARPTGVSISPPDADF